jgi:hypothetical protein
MAPNCDKNGCMKREECMRVVIDEDIVCEGSNEYIVRARALKGECVDVNLQEGVLVGNPNFMNNHPVLVANSLVQIGGDYIPVRLMLESKTKYLLHKGTQIGVLYFLTIVTVMQKI